jgi:hypothetical protein
MTPLAVEETPRRRSSRAVADRSGISGSGPVDLESCAEPPRGGGGAGPQTETAVYQKPPSLKPPGRVQKLEMKATTRIATIMREISRALVTFDTSFRVLV